MELGVQHGAFGEAAAGETATRVNLTALMDILSNIIFFLMVSFGAETLELTSDAKVHLPSSTSELSLKRSISVAVGQEQLLVEDDPVGRLKNGKLTGLNKAGSHRKLEAALKRVRAQRLAKNERQKDEDEVILFIADRDLDYSVIDQVLKTCARAGYAKFRFAVSKK